MKLTALLLGLILLGGCKSERKMIAYVPHTNSGTFRIGNGHIEWAIDGRVVMDCKSAGVHRPISNSVYSDCQLTEGTDFADIMNLLDQEVPRCTPDKASQ